MKRCCSRRPGRDARLERHARARRAAPACGRVEKSERHEQHRGRDREREKPVDQERATSCRASRCLPASTPARNLAASQAVCASGRKPAQRKREAGVTNCRPRVGRVRRPGHAATMGPMATSNSPDDRHRSPRARPRKIRELHGRGAGGRGRACSGSPSRAAAAPASSTRSASTAAPRTATTSSRCTASRSSSTPSARRTSRAPRSTSSTASRAGLRDQQPERRRRRAAAATPSRWRRASARAAPPAAALAARTGLRPV